jgi:DNA-directed RNA polymerase subunit M/transcription elongation factor TFIIS
MNALTHWFAYGDFYRKGVEKKHGKAIAHYVVDYGYSLWRAKRMVKMDTVERIRQNENDRREFTATVDCPKCGIFNVHWIKRRSFRGITRQCRECGHEWRQA